MLIFHFRELITQIVYGIIYRNRYDWMISKYSMWCFIFVFNLIGSEWEIFLISADLELFSK